MKRIGLHWLTRSLVVFAVTLLAACADEAPLGPGGRLGAEPANAQGARVTTPEKPGAKRRAVDLGACENLQVRGKHKLVSRMYPRGVQIYRWNGASWSFVGPSAVLTADAEGQRTVGTHYAGPTWESLSGSKVVGAVLDRCTPTPNAIPWLLLEAVSAEDRGIFPRVTFIQRVHTAGGIAPVAAGGTVGEEVRVPYTTEYYFYRTK